MTKMTQCKKILEFMRGNGQITQRDAISLGCYRLSARIFDLKREGYKITKENLSVQNADGTWSLVALYKLEETEKDG